MNKENLYKIIDSYLFKFDELNGLSGSDESYKWRAQNTFDKYWNIDADNFSEMFQLAMEDTENLIDNKIVQPLGGIKALLKYEEAFVKDCFKLLYTDDGGDLQVRQNRIEEFMDRMNSKIEYYFKSSWKYPQTRTSVIYYLNLWRPNENYIYKYKEASNWADYIEYGDDFGSGSSFSLKKYYKMCDEVKNEIVQHAALIERHAACGLRKLDKQDDAFHILVYDLIYCANAYGFYSKIPKIKMSTKERIEKAKKQEEKEKTERLLIEKEAQLDALKENQILMPDIVNAAVFNKAYGVGRVNKIERLDTVQYAYVEFDVGTKQFVFPNAFIQGFLLLKDSKLNEQMHNSMLISDAIATLEKELDELSQKYRMLQKSL